MVTLSELLFLSLLLSTCSKGYAGKCNRLGHSGWREKKEIKEMDSVFIVK